MSEKCNTLLKFIRIYDLDLKDIKKTKKVVFICNSSNHFLQYFCFLAIKKQLQNLFNKINIQTCNVSNEELINNMLATSTSLISKKCEAKLVGFFILNEAKDNIIQPIIDFIIARLNSKNETVELFYLDSLTSIKNRLPESIITDLCFVIDFYNIPWNDLKKVVDYMFNYFNITATKAMLEKAYYTFLPANFYDLFTILNIIDLAGIDKSNNLALEKAFIELIKNVIQQRRLKSVIKKDLKSFFHWKNKQSINDNAEWKSFLKYKVMDLLEEDLSKDLKIEEKVNWWDDLINSLREVDLKSVKESVTPSAYNLFLSDFIFKYHV